MPDLELIQGDAIAVMRKLAQAGRKVQAIITSFPYYQCRPYPVEDSPWSAVNYIPIAGLPEFVVEPWRGQLGHERNLFDYVGHVIAICRAAWPLLHDRGCMLLNFGDVFNTESAIRVGSGDKIGYSEDQVRRETDDPLQNKDLCMVPSRVAMALQADGWLLRGFFPWYKPDANTDGKPSGRPAINHEHWILVAKKDGYYWDNHAAAICGIRTTGDYWIESLNNSLVTQGGVPLAITANTGKSDFHSAPYSQDLVEPLIRSATSDRGVCPHCGNPWIRQVEKHKTSKKSAAIVRTIGWKPSCKCPDNEAIPATVLDFFAGSGTSLEVARKLGRSSIGIELSPEYFEETKRRLEQVSPEELKQEKAQLSFLT